ncbi:MAG: aminopeptidase P family protein [Clostridia bacterium]|nr:aminopeptidase P family protein [Clostridia bacterium]
MSLPLQKVRDAMQASGLDALFVTDELNQRYLTGYPFTDGMLLILPQTAYMVTDFRYFEEAQKNADPAFEIVMPSPRAAFVTEKLKDAAARTVGFESAQVSYDEYKRLCERYPDFSFAPVGDMLSVIRRVKSEEELSLMAQAQSITDQAFSHILEVMTPAMTEIEVALELEFFMRRRGASGLAFETIAVSGDASALPHGKPRAEKLHPGFLTMDFGAAYRGYCSDMTRTVVVGRADAEMKHLYSTVLAAQQAGIEAVRAGAECAAVDRVAREIIDRHERYRGAFGHSLGHAVGLFIHESPRLASTAKGQYLETGNVVTVEPGIYLAGRYGCRIEDMVAVTDTGCRDFTASPKELIELF